METYYPGFYWNVNYGNGVWWRNHAFYAEKYSDHANHVGEIIVGAKGINPTAELISVQLDTNWNGMTGEMNYLMYYTNIINHSWVFLHHKDWENYNGYSEYLDDLIYNNSELINVISAGNEGYYGSPYRQLLGTTLSQNSIIVGALDKKIWRRKKAEYSQVGNELNYISVAVPGTYNFSDGSTDRGTSFAAPAVTAMATMLKQDRKYRFDQGSDSIIFKSALLTGSRKPKTTNQIYTNETGFGIPNYKLMNQALDNLSVFYISNNSISDIRTVYLSEGETLRASIAYLYGGNSHKVDIDLQLIDPDQTSVALSLSSNKNAEVIEYTAQKSGYYKLKTYGLSNFLGIKEVALTYVKK
ncbi:S8 family serine peptidase [Ureaplasma sp. ES3154-GEN]|uniref:S8 family serine peptidase n=1 Tax=Ureaplasma sp. ES3154-GEN TaxID=2984844 RepID=UPI0021E979F6|nr:S8 family serine peptidase [Ureaplasma sp. ES3154-GEN]MCV3743506.1 S8 family serine peptidase [Ureaplasma sp. ES3154-GEN]